MWFLIPGGTLIVVIIVLPAILAVVMSFMNLDVYTLRDWVTAPFIGFANYIEALSRSPLLGSLLTSGSSALLATLLSIPLGVAAAIATQNKMPGRTFLRSLFLIPYVLPSFVVATMWRTMFIPNGVVDNTLAPFGLDGALWTAGPQSYWTYIFVVVWSAWPFVYLLTLAGLQSVDHEVHEAAALDGARWWRKLWYIIFPYLRGPVALAAVIATLHHINNFTIPFVMFGLPVPEAVRLLPILTYTTSFESFRFGLGAAMTLVSLVLIAIPLFIYLRAVRLDTGEKTQ